jgi:triosephosphate isomerase
LKQIFVNLKRFDVPRSQGGLCSQEDPIAWIQGVIDQSVQLGMGSHPGLGLVYLLPEGLIPAAVQSISGHPEADTRMIAVGCQGVHWDNVAPGKNFGAFTTAVPAAAAKNLGSAWAIIGHSEERRFKSQIIQAYEPQAASQPELRARAAAAVDGLIHAEVEHALGSGLNVLLCVGEAAEERGEGSFEEQQSRIQAVLEQQLAANLKGLPEMIGDRQVVIGYEPIWAIGPGKIPPGKEYIGFVSALIQQVVRQRFGYEIPVVYGGGLKEENAAMIASIATIGGGLVALTRFTGEIGFDVSGLKGIVDKYLA